MALLTVSVIIPAYNAAGYIGETLDSVYAQTLTDFEVIVVNDGSPDTEDLEQALARFPSSLRYLKQENSGAAAARNTGIRAAQGEVVAFRSEERRVRKEGRSRWSPDPLKKSKGFRGPTASRRRPARSTGRAPGRGRPR